MQPHTSCTARHNASAWPRHSKAEHTQTRTEVDYDGVDALAFEVPVGGVGFSVQSLEPVPTRREWAQRQRQQPFGAGWMEGQPRTDGHVRMSGRCWQLRLPKPMPSAWVCTHAGIFSPSSQQFATIPRPAIAITLQFAPNASHTYEPQDM